MALIISDELIDKYHDFYYLVKGRYTTGMLVLSDLDDEKASALTDAQKSVKNVAVIKSPRLTSLSFLEDFKNAENICINNCNKIRSFWDLSKNDNLKGVAVINCKKIVTLEGIDKKTDLQNFLFECGVFNRTRLPDLKPVMNCRKLLTLDIATTSIKDKSKIDFSTQWPSIESLTVSLSIKKLFIKLGGKQ